MGGWPERGQPSRDRAPACRTARRPTIADEPARDHRRRASSGPRAGATPNDSRDVDEPAPTILAGGTSPGEQAWVLRSGQSVAGEGRAERSVDDPSLTITGRTDLCSWEGPPTCWCREHDRRGRAALAPANRSARPTVRGGRNGCVGMERPSTSVNCDPRIAEPGRHDPDESGSQYGAGTVRVTVEEAAALQSFPAGYPWEAAGTRTAAFRCVGNAVPCGLARAIVSMAVGTT